MSHQVDPSHYLSRAYNSKERFISYWHQISQITSLTPGSVLEVGIGNGLVGDFLKKVGVSVSTLDIDERLKPDFNASVLAMPFPSASFDVVACFETLEHQPYSDFLKAMREIHRVSRKYAILSLPDRSKAYRLSVQFPKLGEIKMLIPFPGLKPPHHVFNGQHYWEIGTAECELKQLKKQILSAGFEIEDTYRIFEHPYHRFFVLRKSVPTTE